MSSMKKFQNILVTLNKVDNIAREQRSKVRAYQHVSMLVRVTFNDSYSLSR